MVFRSGLRRKGSRTELRPVEFHNGDSRGEPGRNPSPVAELKALYAAAKSESDRREICLRAIDEGIIKTNEGVATIDEIFGTHLASQSATKQDNDQRLSISFLLQLQPRLLIRVEPMGGLWRLSITRVER